MIWESWERYAYGLAYPTDVACIVYITCFLVTRPQDRSLEMRLRFGHRWITKLATSRPTRPHPSEHSNSSSLKDRWQREISSIAPIPNFQDWLLVGEARQQMAGLIEISGPRFRQFRVRHTRNSCRLLFLNFVPFSLPYFLRTKVLFVDGGKYARLLYLFWNVSTLMRTNSAEGKRREQWTVKVTEE